MNVAVKTFNQTTTIPFSWSWSLPSKIYLPVICLMFAVLCSAFGVVYVKDINRRLSGDLQTLQNSYTTLHTQWSQALLENSTWSSDARIERIAKEQLGMMLPKTKTIILPTDEIQKS